MAITLDSASYKSSSSKTSDPISHTCTGTGQDGRLIVCVSVWGGGGGGIEAYTVDYGSSSLTQVYARAVTDTGVVSVAIFELINPTAGTASITVTTDGSSDDFVTFATSWTGVSEDPTEQSFDGYGSYLAGTLPSVNVTTGFDNAMIVDCATRSLNNSTWTAGAGQTIVQQYSFGSGFQSHAGCSYKSVASAGATTMSWDSITTVSNWLDAAVVLYPAGGRMKMIGVDKIIFS